jgi:hypothetical protein
LDLSAKALGFDRYDLNARLRPALFTGAPVMLMVAVWVPAVWTAIGGLSSILIGCGLTLVLSRIARHLGRQLQDRLAPAAGPRHTMTLLRHADGAIDPETKARYHSWLRARGRHIPTRAEENRNPASADRHYLASVTWLLEATRDAKRFRLLAEENLDYGFRRNLRALKPVAIVILAVAIAADAWLGIVHVHGASADLWKAVVLGACLCGDLALWTWAITTTFVSDASLSFGARLLASCDTL